MKKTTDVNIIIDRSGSMESIKDSATSGVEEFINQQATEGVEGFISLFQFDDEYEEVIKGVKIKDAKKALKDKNWSLFPRGLTALNDSIGRSINATGERLAKLDKKDRPDVVLFLIVTDGIENASQEFSREKIKEMVEHQQDKYNWKFVYLGANQDAVLKGGGLGISRDTSATYAMGNIQTAIHTVGSNNVGIGTRSLDPNIGYSISSADRKSLTEE